MKGELGFNGVLGARPNESYQVIPDLYAHAENGVRRSRRGGANSSTVVLLGCWIVSVVA